jgi:hypothetical protein
LQPVVEVIRNHGADNIIWIPGLGWQSNCKGFASKPVAGTNIGYAVHIYPACGDIGNNPRAIRKPCNSQYKPIADKAPVNITEVWWRRWSDQDVEGDPNRYGKLFDGVTGADKRGFGTALKNITEKQGNVRLVFPHDLKPARPRPSRQFSRPPRRFE